MPNFANASQFPVRPLCIQTYNVLPAKQRHQNRYGNFALVCGEWCKVKLLKPLAQSALKRQSA